MANGLLFLFFLSPFLPGEHVPRENFPKRQVSPKSFRKHSRFGSLQQIVTVIFVFHLFESNNLLESAGMNILPFLHHNMDSHLSMVFQFHCFCSWLETTFLSFSPFLQQSALHRFATARGELHCWRCRSELEGSGQWQGGILDLSWKNKWKEHTSRSTCYMIRMIYWAWVIVFLWGLTHSW